MTAVGRHQKFKEWLMKEMDKREWSQADLARYADLNRAVINKLLNGHSATPRPATLEAIARAFKVPVEKVYRVAGLLPEVPENEGVIEEALHHLSQIQDPKRKSAVISVIKALAEEEKKEKKPKVTIKQHLRDTKNSEIFTISEFYF